MARSNLILEFNKRSLQEKIEFFEQHGEALLSHTDGLALYQFLKTVVSDPDANSFVRKKGLELFVNALLIKKIKVRQALTLLIDDWQEDELFLELERIKALYLVYDQDPNAVTAILQFAQSSEEADLAAEACYRLGLIGFQNALTQPGPENVLAALYISKDLFGQAAVLIENRSDAQVLSIVCETIVELINGNFKAAKRWVAKIARQLFQLVAFTFGPERSSVYLGFYRTLVSVVAVATENPAEWLDFRNDLRRVSYYFSLIQNEKLNNRLFASVSQDTFAAFLSQQLLDPFFALNYRAEKAKIELLMMETGGASDDYQFMSHLKGLLEQESAQVKLQSATIAQSLSRIFRHRTPESIDKAVKGIADPGHVPDVLKAYELLAMPSIERFTDKLVYACVMLQGNRKFWGNCPEDDRNTFVASLLEAADYQVKDQTRWSVSHGGKAAGEIDIQVKELNGLPFTIIEALNLASLQTDYLVLHLNKLFNYDANGLRYNFILVYFEGKKYDTFWKNYYQFIAQHQYPYAVTKAENLSLDLADIRLAKTVHSRNGTEVILFHLVIDLNKV